MARVRILRENDEWFASHKEHFDAPIRKRAFEIYCDRDEQARSATADWEAAKRELALLPLVGVEETDRDIRVSACVADEDFERDSVITLRVMPHHIIAESGNRFSVLNLPHPVRTDAVRATLDGDQLRLIANKA